MPTYIDPSQQTPLFTAQQVTCAYPISDYYADGPRYLYYALLVACILIRWHPWLSDAFLGAAATYAGVAAIEAFVLLAGWTRDSDKQLINIPFISPASLPGNATFARLPNLVTNWDHLYVQPHVLEYDIDAILAIVVTGYLFMLPVQCWSTHVRGSRVRHILMGMWSVLMLSATICSLILWTRLGDAPFQFRFCYPSNPDIDTVTNDGWQSALWRGDWNSTIWGTFGNSSAANILTENCIYPCFNTSQVLRRSQSIVATLTTNDSPRTNNDVTYSEAAHLTRLVNFMYTAISISAFAAIVVLLMTSIGMQRITVIPLAQPTLIWTDRKRIRERVVSDFKNVIVWRHKKDKKTGNGLPKSEKEAEATLKGPTPTSTSTSLTVSTLPRSTRRRRSMIRLFSDLIAFIIFLIVSIIIPATWVTFIIWIEWWIHKDLVSQETPRQVGQWAPAASVGLILFSAWVLRLKYWLASRREVELEIGMLKLKLAALEQLMESKKS